MLHSEPEANKTWVQMLTDICWILLLGLSALRTTPTSPSRSCRTLLLTLDCRRAVVLIGWSCFHTSAMPVT